MKHIFCKKKIYHTLELLSLIAIATCKPVPRRHKTYVRLFMQEGFIFLLSSRTYFLISEA